MFKILFVFAVMAAAQQLRAANPTSNAVVFRLDDLQDDWIVPSQRAVMDVFKESKIPLSVGIIANIFGQDENIVEYVKTALEIPDWNFEVGNHGFNHEYFDKLSEKKQSDLLKQSREKTLSVLSPHLTSEKFNMFIPPYNAINAETIPALKKNGFKIMSSMTDIDEGPYPFENTDFFRWPIYPATVDQDAGYDLGLSPDVVFDQVVYSMNQWGFASVMMHPQEFSVLDKNKNPTDQVNEEMIQNLKQLIRRIQDQGYQIVTFRDVASRFLQTETSPTSPLTTSQSVATTRTGSTSSASISPSPSPSTSPSSGQIGEISFVLHQVQDWWLTSSAIAAIDTFKVAQLPLTVGIIPSHFGEDLLFRDAIRSEISSASSSCSSWNIEIAANGYRFEQFGGRTLEIQREDLKNGRDSLQNSLGVSPVTFVPPYHSFDNNTRTALKENGYTALSSSQASDPPPYSGSSTSSIRRFPSGASFGSTGKSSTATWNLARLQLESYGFAVIELSIQDFATVNGSLDSQSISQLSDLLSLVKSSGRGVSTVSKLGIPIDLSSCSKLRTETSIEGDVNQFSSAKFHFGSSSVLPFGFGIAFVITLIGGVIHHFWKKRRESNESLHLPSI
eukprot:TRINITY_DN5682_c0_g1_i1.p1 TRINITY_DN5682_c0_g1~~TRINITY_DN5682_c0_g1_i1.p1  ORF type:complete len:617 (-),score=175.46 TRINITY_DN5682_c0_g1_i1:59-1909(-)